MPDWDDIFREKGHVFSEPHPEMSRLVEIFHARNAKKILDLGCGTGRHILFLASHGFEMYGIDASEQAIRLTKELLAEANLSAFLHLHRMECTFPFEDSFFDAILSVQVIHHNRMADILGTVREITRMTRNGGVLFISVPVLEDGSVSRKRDWALKEIEDGTYIPQKGPESGIPHHYFTPEELHQVFFEFEILEIYLDRTGHRCMLAMKR